MGTKKCGDAVGHDEDITEGAFQVLSAMTIRQRQSAPSPNLLEKRIRECCRQLGGRVVAIE